MTVRGYQVAVDWSRQGLFTGTLEDVSSYVSDDEVTASWGRSEARATTDAAVGSLAFVLVNDSGIFSPGNPVSPIGDQVLPGTPARLQVTDPSTAGTVTLFSGTMNAPEVDGSTPSNAFSAAVSDGWGKPGDTKLSTAVYQGLRTGDLIGVILDAIGWPAARRSIDPGATVVPYWWVDGADAATAVADLVHSEGAPAIAYVQGGVFVFRDRHRRLMDATSAISQGVYTHLIPAAAPITAGSDPFTRTVAAGSWGSADTGGAWTVSPTGDFSVSTGSGRVSLGSVGVERVASLPVTVPDVDLAATFATSAVAAGAPVNGYLVGRRTDDNNRYLARLSFDTTGVIFVGLEKFVAGTVSGLGPLVSTGISYSAGGRYRMRLQVTGSTVRARVWAEAGTEPSTWQVSQTDTSLPGSALAATSVGVRAILSGGNTNTLPVTLSVDDFTVLRLNDYKILSRSMRYSHGLANVINSATLEVTPRIPQNRQVVWSTDDPITLGASESQTLVIRTDDPFIDLQLPVPLIAYLDDGTFTYDYHLASGAITFALSRTSGQSAYLTMTAGASGAILDTGLRVRGTPLKQGATRVYTSSDTASLNAYGDADWGGDAPWAHFYDADVIVRSVVSGFAQPRPVVTFDVDGVISPATLTRILATQVSDRITVRDDELGIDADFMVEQVTHTITKLGVRHRLTIGAQTAAPAQASNPFTFDVSGQGFDQGQFTLDQGTDPGSMFVFDTAAGATQGFGAGRFAA